MGPVQEVWRSGRESLAEVTRLLQRVRAAHPTAGPFEAADVQWAWRTPRTTDDLPQLFWVDADGQPTAAVIITDQGERISLDPFFLPDTAAGFVAHVVERGLAHAADHGFDAIGLEVGLDDHVLHGVLERNGFAVAEDGVFETWLAAGDRPAISPLADGYRLSTRADVLRSVPVGAPTPPHHMTNAGRNHADVEPRLRQTSLYRADLDLVVHDADGAVAAYGLFWNDPVTATALVEPMRTEDAHQRRGLARHVLTAGIDRLAAAGAERIKICFEPGNPGSSHLYLDAGFVPDRRTVTYARDRATGS